MPAADEEARQEPKSCFEKEIRPNNSMLPPGKLQEAIDAEVAALLPTTSSRTTGLPIWNTSMGSTKRS